MKEQAVEFAKHAHEGQFRKGTKRPYITHPLEVMEIVSHMTEDDEMLCAAVLHDTIEDCKGVSKETLEEQFGRRVAELVAGESEDKTKSWEERKLTTIEHLQTASKELQMIGLADKLSNMRDIDRDYPKLKDELWTRFRMKDKDIIGWYYKSIKEVLETPLGNLAEYQEYRELVEKYFGRENPPLDGLLKKYRGMEGE